MKSWTYEILDRPNINHDNLWQGGIRSIHNSDGPRSYTLPALAFCPTLWVRRGFQARIAVLWRGAAGDQRFGGRSALFL